MNINITYNFSLPDDEHELHTLQAANAMCSAIYEFDNYLRSFKHRELSRKEDKLLEEIKEKYYEYFNEAHVKLGEY